jgi:uncharacterized protein (DUF433 family)
MSTLDLPPLRVLVTSRDDVLGGRPVFRNTRVPVETLFDNLADGLSLDEILDSYPTLDRADVVSVLQHAASALATSEAA